MLLLFVLFVLFMLKMLRSSAVFLFEKVKQQGN